MCAPPGGPACRPSSGVLGSIACDRRSVNFQGMYAQARYNIMVVSMMHNFYEISDHRCPRTFGLLLTSDCLTVKVSGEIPAANFSRYCMTRGLEPDE